MPEAEINLANSNHDEKGRFATGGGGGLNLDHDFGEPTAEIAHHRQMEFEHRRFASDALKKGMSQSNKDHRDAAGLHTRAAGAHLAAYHEFNPEVAKQRQRIAQEASVKANEASDALKHNSLSRQDGLGDGTEPLAPGTTETAGWTPDDPPVEEPDPTEEAVNPPSAEEDNANAMTNPDGGYKDTDQEDLSMIRLDTKMKSKYGMKKFTKA